MGYTKEPQWNTSEISAAAITAQIWKLYNKISDALTELLLTPYSY
jgi:hypothetical protein